MSSDFRFLLISAMYENGGNTTHRLLDGHPALQVYPFESQLGTRLVDDALASLYPKKYRWPVFALDASPENDFRAIIDEELEQVWNLAKTPKQALDAAAERGNQLLRKFEAANKAGVRAGPAPGAAAAARGREEQQIDNSKWRLLWLLLLLLLLLFARCRQGNARGGSRGDRCGEGRRSRGRRSGGIRRVPEDPPRRLVLDRGGDDRDGGRGVARAQRAERRSGSSLRRAGDEGLFAAFAARRHERGEEGGSRGPR